MRSSGFIVVPFFTAAVVLAWSGLAKLRKPAQLARALDAAGVTAGFGGVRLIGSAEAALGVVCLARPTPGAAAALGVAYLGFAAFLVFLLTARPATGSCGCAGDREVPPSWFHVALDMLGAASAFAFAVSIPHARDIMTTALSLPLNGVSFLAGVGLLGYLSFLSAAYLTQAVTSYRGTT
jgi:hypothetical protein